MGRGDTSLANYEYDDWLAKNKKHREVEQRKAERRNAHKPDGSGYHFGIDSVPVKAKDKDDFRKQLAKRGLAIEGEYKPGDNKHGR